MSIKAVLFDFDGTLIDTNELIYKSFVHTFNKYGYTFTKEEIMTFNGPPLRETFGNLDPTIADEMIATYRKHNRKYHEQYVELFPHVKETLQILTKKKIPLAIVTAK